MNEKEIFILIVIGVVASLFLTSLLMTDGWSYCWTTEGYKLCAPH